MIEDRVPLCREATSIYHRRKDLLKYFVDEEDAKYCNSQSKFPILVKCPVCGTVKSIRPVTLMTTEYICLKCMDREPFSNKMMGVILDNLRIEYIKEKEFDFLNQKYFDIFVPSLNLVIEMHGAQHYDEGICNFKNIDVEEVKKNDDYKMDAVITNGISYIAIDCMKSNFFYIKKSIIESNLSDFINMDSLNWTYVREHSAKKNVLESICDKWNSLPKEERLISKFYKDCGLSTKIVRRYLELGSELGMIPNYKTNKPVHINSKRVGKYDSDGNLIEEYKSILKLSEILGIEYTALSSRLCRGTANYNGFHYDYIKEATK